MPVGAKQLKAVIYCVRSIEHAEPFYIGSTRDPLAKRWASHQYQIKTKQHRNKHFANKCLKFGFDRVVCEVIESVPIEQQFIREYEIIQEHLSRNVALTNIKLVNEYQAQQAYYEQPAVIQEKVLLWLHSIKNRELHIAANPRDQRMLDKLNDVIALILESMVTKHASEFCAIMREPCQ